MAFVNSVFYFYFFNYSISKLLHICRMIRNALFSEETAAILCNEDVVLNADTTEVLVGLQQVVVDEVLMQTL